VLRALVAELCERGEQILLMRLFRGMTQPSAPRLRLRCPG
jgi:hypothetical protein